MVPEYNKLHDVGKYSIRLYMEHMGIFIPYETRGAGLGAMNRVSQPSSYGIALKWYGSDSYCGYNGL